MSTKLTLAAALALATVVTPAEAGDHTLEWYEGSFLSARREAARDHSMIMIAFTPEWSDYSKKVEEVTLDDPGVAKALSAMIAVQLTDSESNEMTALVEKYGITTYPSFVFTTPTGDVEERIEGFLDAGTMVEWVGRVLEGYGTVSYFREMSEKTPEDLAARHDYATKLGGVGRGHEAADLIASIRRDDPSYSTVAGVRVRSGDLWGEIYNAAEGDPSKYDMEPMFTFLSGLDDDAAAYEGWDNMARYLVEVDRHEEARRGFRNAWKHIADDKKPTFGTNVVGYLLESHRSQPLDKTSRKFALHVASDALTAAEEIFETEMTEADLKPEKKAAKLASYNSWLAERVAQLAECKAMLGGESGAAEAVDLVKRCISLDPESKEYRGRLERLQARL